MSEVHLKFELTGLKIEFKGMKDDVPLIAKNLATQLAGAIQPVARIASGEEPPRVVEANVVDLSRVGGPAPLTKRSRKAKASVAHAPTEETTLALEHDSAKWGTPPQSWTHKQKLIWLFYVLEKQGKGNKFSAPALSRIFNKYFEKAGHLKPNHVSRELGRLKDESPPQVATDESQEPAIWWLVEEGERNAKALVDGLAKANPDNLFPSA